LRATGAACGGASGTPSESVATDLRTGIGGGAAGDFTADAATGRGCALGALGAGRTPVFAPVCGDAAVAAADVAFDSVVALTAAGFAVENGPGAAP
jgi:hypothetical protein